MESANRIIDLCLRWQDPGTWLGLQSEVEMWKDFKHQATIHYEMRGTVEHAERDGKILDQQAEQARLRAVVLQGELVTLQNLLRVHTPELLKFCPAANALSHELSQADIDEHCRSIREIEGAVRATITKPVDGDEEWSEWHSPAEWERAWDCSAKSRQNHQRDMIHQTHPVSGSKKICFRLQDLAARGLKTP